MYRFFTIILYSTVFEYYSRKWLFILYLLFYMLQFHFNSKVVPEYIYVNKWYFSLLLRNYNNSDTFYNKPRLLVLIASVVISLSIVPFILPHIFHPYMIYHILLHIVVLILFQFLAVVSLMAYLKSMTSRILFMTLGFVTLVIAEYVYSLDSTENFHVLYIFLTLILRFLI